MDISLYTPLTLIILAIISVGTMSWLFQSTKVSNTLGKKSTALDVIKAFGEGKYLTGKTAIVTGGNAGIGLETCKALAYAGCRVILCSRSLDNAKKAIETEIMKPGIGKYVVDDTSNIIIKALDLDSLKSIKTFADDILATESRIDLLVLNAGIMALPKLEFTSSGFEKQIGVNHFGHAYLTSLLRDKMVSQDFPSRIVCLSSVANNMGKIVADDLHFKNRPYSPWAAYGQSKLANILFSKHLADELVGTKVSTVSLHPGIIATNLYTDTGILGFLASYLATDKNIPQGASTTLWACVSPRVENADFQGTYLLDCAPYKPNPIAEDKAVRDALMKSTYEQLKDATEKLSI